MNAPTTHEALKEAFRLSLDLEPMQTAPAEGTTFTAFLTSGQRVTAERFDDAFVCGNTGAPSRPLRASEFIGWLYANVEGGTYEASGPYVLSERQEAAEYIAEEYDLDRSMGREE